MKKEAGSSLFIRVVFIILLGGASAYYIIKTPDNTNKDSDTSSQADKKSANIIDHLNTLEKNLEKEIRTSRKNNYFDDFSYNEKLKMESQLNKEAVKKHNLKTMSGIKLYRVLKKEGST
ncbi:hypothetical protein [Gilvimarinus polysaccharolyticus]|uniref:hypothetical protein n=1 Tax=Gilvimarinus polysaccharolyticus TaxID=863921 RepID=UPI0006736271|nr:hypothetical protein [Gilvimarinus polysaccharolyticus]